MKRVRAPLTSSGQAVRLTSPRHESGRMVRVLPGDYYVTGDPDVTIATILGSCVAACVRDPFTGFGGLNHFMLPEGDSGEWNGIGAAFRYGNFAMEALINAVLKSGCARQNLEVKLFGGANMHGSVAGVGQKNAIFAKRYLEMEGIPLTSADLGGEYGRRIHYNPATGKVQRLMLKNREDEALRSDEARYSTSLRQTSVAGDIDLFD
jgi:chemotaxis protein CheD